MMVMRLKNLAVLCGLLLMLVGAGVNPGVEARAVSVLLGFQILKSGNVSRPINNKLNLRRSKRDEEEDCMAFSMCCRGSSGFEFEYFIG